MVDVDLLRSAMSGSTRKNERRFDRKHVVGSKRRKGLVQVSLELLDDVEERLVGDDADRNGGGGPGRDESLLRRTGDVDLVDAESGLAPPAEAASAPRSKRRVRRQTW